MWFNRNFFRYGVYMTETTIYDWNQQFVRNQNLFVNLLLCETGVCQPRHCVTHWSLAARRWRFRMVPRYGRRARRPNRLRRLRTVWADIRSLWRPLISLAVTVAGLCLFRRCTRRIWRSCIGKVTEGRPLRGRSLVVPVSCRRCLRRVIIVWDTFKRLAISVGLKPLWSIPTALSLSTLVRRGMTSAIWFCDKLSLWGPANKWLQMFACMRP